MIALEMENVCYRHPRAEEPIISGLSLTCDAGSGTLIAGPVGAGKSTLIQLLAGLLRPDSGEVRASGEPVSRYVAPHRDRWRRQVGLVFQHLWLIEERTVWENVMLPLYPLGLKGSVRNRKVGEALERVALTPFQQSAVSTLSGGERQRCALARALVGSPIYLIADEPTAHMDDAGVTLVSTLFTEAIERGTTVVVVSHDARLDACAVFDRRFVLDSGRLEELDL